MVSIPDCHSGDPGSIPGLGAFLIFFWDYFEANLLKREGLKAAEELLQNARERKIRLQK